jgi:hypothetical protein
LTIALRARVIDDWKLGSSTAASATTVPSSTANTGTTVEDAETALPDITAPEDCEAQVEAEDPPPYQPPIGAGGAVVLVPPPIAPGIQTNNSAPTPASVTLTPQPIVKPTPGPIPSSAHRFVFGTALFAANIFTLFIFALTIQAWLYCSETEYPLFWKIVLWGVYAGVCFFATIAASCWIILCRDLGGKGMKKRWPLDEFCVLSAVRWVLFWLATPLGLIGKGAVRLVKICQGWWCSGVLEEEEEGVELVEGDVSMGGAITGDGSGSNDEARIGLMEEASKGL